VVFYKAPHNEYSCCSGLGITYGVKVVFFFCWAGDGIRASEPQRFMKLLKKNSRHGAW